MKSMVRDLNAIRIFLQEAIEAGELDLGYAQDVERCMLELFQAVRSRDLHLVRVTAEYISRKFKR